MLGTNVIGQDKSRLDLGSNFGSDRIATPSASRAFGLPVRSGAFASQNRLNQDSRNYDRVNMSGLFKPFGLQTRNTTLDSIREENVRLHQSTSIANIRSSSNVSAVSRTFGLEHENVRGSNASNNSRLNQDDRNCHSSSFVPTSFGLQMRNLSALRNATSNDTYKFNQSGLITNYRNNNEQFQTSNSSRIFGPAFRNTTLTNGLQIQERCNDELDNGGFRVPPLPRMIRGRNPITSSRLFSHQSIEKCKNLSNINGFDVTHISRRDMDTMSESRLGLMRNGCMDKQSVSGSVYSTSSVKAQAMNLLENLHYSILNMGPFVSVNAVTVEIEKAKQGLDNLCEMSFAPSVRDADAVSVASHTSKCHCGAMTDQTRSIINGECFNLKSSKEVLKSLAINNSKVKSKINMNQTGKKSKLNASIENIELNLDGEESSLVFKKPKPLTKQKKSIRRLKIKSPPVRKSLTSKITSRIINLRQWYPIAVGKDLALCGIDEQGVAARTDAVKKRINSRKVELINGLSCTLIGSPSSMASALPKDVASLIKNGLTPYWRVLQKKLLNCQTVEEKRQKRISKSPGGKGSPMRLRSPQKVTATAEPATGSVQKSPRRKVKGKKLNISKTKLTALKKMMSEERIAEKKLPHSRVISSPKKRGNDVRTRSGRTIKPPSMFWIGSRGIQTPSPESSVLQKTVTETPMVKPTKTQNKSKRTVAEFSRKAFEECDIAESHVNSTISVEKSKKSKAVGSRKKRERSQKVKQNESKKDTPKAIAVVSSTDKSTGGTMTKRKREPNADAESRKRKKSKVESLEELAVESTVMDTNMETKASANNWKQKKTQITKGTQSLKAKAKGQSKKKKGISTEKTIKTAASTAETKFIREMEEDFELQLDDIEIPQFGNLSGNPQLSRSQLRLVSAETPPLKYFNSNLKVLSNTTPMRSPDWVISQRTESEVKQFQKRRAEAFKKKVEVQKTKSKKTVVVEKAQSRDLKKILEWVAEKTVQSPQWSSKALEYVLPSRRQLEQQEDEEEEYESEFV